MATAWRSLLETALIANRDDPTSRYFQLATIGLDHRPANRTVVFRGFRAETDDILITADVRSRKIREVLHASRAEACWYMGHTREQFRLGGSTKVIDRTSSQTQLRVNLWQSLSDAVRVQFTWPTPGADWVDEPEYPRGAPPSRSVPPDAFGVLILEVERVDYLSLASDPPLRQIHKTGLEGWSTRRINP